MAPGGGGKRKRGDRTYSQDSSHDGSRPSPHRPGDLSLAQQGYHQGQQHHGYHRDQQEYRGRGGGRRGARGGRGGGPARSPMNSPNAIPVQRRFSNTTSGAMSPPPIPTQRQEEPSQNAPVRSPTPTKTSATQTPAQPEHNVSSYDYEHITKDRLDMWRSTGRKEIVEMGNHYRAEQDALKLGSLYQELIRLALDKRLDPVESGSVIKDTLGTYLGPSDATEDLAIEPDVGRLFTLSLFLDCLSILTEVDYKNLSLRSLVISTGIPPELMRQELEHPLLEALGMIRNTFFRTGIRQQTNLLYRQSNYNLLREETEGYSKLVTELFTTSSNEPPSSEVVEETFEQVKGMIGAFDLDVGRVLDITLDVFAAVLVKQYRFFVKYLRASSWWPQERLFHGIEPFSVGLSALPKWALPGSSGWTTSEAESEETAVAREERDSIFWRRVREVGIIGFFELGSRRVAQSKLEAALRADGEEGEKPLDETKKWIKSTNTLPPLGNKIAAQVLGFKLQFYSSSARDATDILPVNLIYLAALLIKTGFISLKDLYPHLWPPDETMEAVKEEKMKEKAEREKLNRPGGGAMNALMMAGALADDTVPAVGRLREVDGNRGTPLRTDPASEKENAATPGAVEEKEHLPEPLDQKVQLLKSLLCIGAIPEALYILGRFPWLPDAFPELPEYIHRILNQCLSKIYEPSQPLEQELGLQHPQQVQDQEQSGVPKNQVRLTDIPPRKPKRWAQLDKYDSAEGTEYKFYWDDWVDSVPICQTVDDVFLLCGTLLNYTGVKIGQDPALLLKLARIGSVSLVDDTSDANIARWTDLSKRLLVPALSLTRHDPGVVNEVFELIKNFSISTRYSIYAEWYSGSVSRLPDIKAAFDLARAETKDVLKRISKTNVKPMARALAKVAYASPGIVFSVAIAQIESYDNLVETVVECARYFTYLGYDVLTWSLMSSLGVKGRNRVQADGMLTSRWLAALALFAGKVFKRYSIMSPTPLLQYVTDQLRKNNSTDLIVLEEITSSMAGIVSDTSFNEAQVLSMAGGELLQAQTMLQLLDRRHESKTTARRLMKSLVEPRLAGQLLVSIAQERQTCIFKISEPDAHLKLLGNLSDEIHRILTQYLDLLRSNMSVKEFDALVPGISQLISEFGVQPSVAFWISRSSITAAMVEADTVMAKQLSERKEPAEAGNGVIDQDITMTGGDDDPPVKLADDTAEESSRPLRTMTRGSPNKDQAEINVTEVSPSVSSTSPTSLARVSVFSKPWHPVLQSIIDSIRPALPEQTWDHLSVPFYVTFWQLSLRDMVVSSQSYEDEINRLKKRVVAVSNDRTDYSSLGAQKRDREKKSLTELQDRLRAELKDQIQTYTQTRSRLAKEKDHWFTGSWRKWDALNTALLEHCFFPRLVLSPVDAMYAFKMLKFLHSSGAANFRTMGVLDQFFMEKRLTSLIFLCTSKEAENLGRFLSEVLRDLARWHADAKVYEKEAFGSKKDLPGFAKKMKEKAVDTFLDYEDFRRILLKWHRNLNSALKTCWSGGEYMHIRNAIIVLKAVHQSFPAVNWMGQNQLASVTELSKSESREDLKIAATSLLGNLKRRDKDWLLPQAFSLNESGSTGMSGVRSNSAKPGTPQSGIEQRKVLRADAAEFQPSQRLNVNGNSKMPTTASGRLEAEDGEIEDEKWADKSTELKTPILTVQQSQIVSKGHGVPESVMDSPANSTAPQSSPSSQPTHTANQGQVSQPSKPVSYPPINPVTTHQLHHPPPKPESRPPQESSTAHLPMPVRADVSGLGSNNATAIRTPHDLPDRPESQRPKPNDHRIPERPGGRDLLWETRFPDHNRTERPKESSRERLPDRVPAEPLPRYYNHPPDRSDRRTPSDRDRTEANWGGEKSTAPRPPFEDRYNGPPNRDSRALAGDENPEKSQRDRIPGESLHSAKFVGGSGRSSRASSMAPPRSNVTTNPERMTFFQDSTEPKRGPKIKDGLDNRLDSPRTDAHARSDRSSRPQSPARRDDRRPSRYDSRHNDRLHIDGRSNIEDSQPSHLSRYDDHWSGPPAAPRIDRSGMNDRAREIPRRTPPPALQTDPNHGRLNQESSNHPQQESQYGRLNAGAEVPSGPRFSNGLGSSPPHGGRNTNAPQPHMAPQQAHLSVNTQMTFPATKTPTGPSVRASARPAAQFSRPPSAPQTPIAETPDTASIHPDRLRHIEPAPPTDITPPSHLPRQSNYNPPPAGPRAPFNHQNPPSPSSQQSRPTPTGPSFPSSNERPPRGGDKRFAGLQTMLQQGGGNTSILGPESRPGQGASIRGRGGRINSGGSGIPSPNHSAPMSGRENNFSGRPSNPFASNRNGEGGMPQRGPEEEYSIRGGRRDSGRDHGRDELRDGLRDGREAGRNARGERRPSKYFDQHDGSDGRDRVPTTPFNAGGGTGPSLQSRIEDERPPPTRRDEGPPHRDSRLPRSGMSISGGANGRHMDSGRRDLRDQEYGAEPDRKNESDVGAWTAQRGEGMRNGAGLRLDRRDTREPSDGRDGRKRGRAGEEGPEAGKRPRRMG